MIVFDLDDTLYKEHHYVLSGYEAVARRISIQTGMEPWSVLSYMLLSPDPMAAAAEVGTQKVDDYVFLYRNHYPSISLDPAALNFLSELKDRGIPMAMITDGRAVGQRNKYLALGLDRFIPAERLLISEETGAEKTEPLAFEKLMQTCPDEKQWFYIGDNPAKDFIHPNVLGWITIMLRDNFNENIHRQPAEIPPGHAARHTVVSLPQALPIILNTI